MNLEKKLQLSIYDYPPQRQLVLHEEGNSETSLASTPLTGDLEQDIQSLFWILQSVTQIQSLPTISVFTREPGLARVLSSAIVEIQSILGTSPEVTLTREQSDQLPGVRRKSNN